MSDMSFRDHVICEMHT